MWGYVKYLTTLTPLWNFLTRFTPEPNIWEPIHKDSQRLSKRFTNFCDSFCQSLWIFVNRFANIRLCFTQFPNSNLWRYLIAPDPKWRLFWHFNVSDMLSCAKTCNRFSHYEFLSLRSYEPETPSQMFQL